MVGYAKRQMPRQRPSKDQREFLEMVRDLGPRDNAQSATVRKGTKRACQVRGWVEWRSLDNFPGVMAWHLTIIGQKVFAPARAATLGLPRYGLMSGFSMLPCPGGDDMTPTRFPKSSDIVEVVVHVVLERVIHHEPSRRVGGQAARPHGVVVHRPHSPSITP